MAFLRCIYTYFRAHKEVLKNLYRFGINPPQTERGKKIGRLEKRAMSAIGNNHQLTAGYSFRNAALFGRRNELVVGTRHYQRRARYFPQLLGNVVVFAAVRQLPAGENGQNRQNADE